MGYESKHTRSHCPGPGSGFGQASQSTSAATGFLDLPGRVRQDVYRRVLAVGHPVYLFQDIGSRVETFAPDKPKWWLALLYTNRQIYSEAKAVLYGRNCFYLMDKPQQQDALLRSFLGCIGASNADLLSCLCISFPVVEKAQEQPEKVSMREDSIQNLDFLHSNCTNLMKLEMQISKENSRFLVEADGEDAQFVRAALQRIDAQLKAICSVDKIVARLYIKDLAPLVIDIMQGFGWVVLNG